jgi:hypothetical protein
VTSVDDTQLDDGGRRKPPSDRAAAAIHRKLAGDAYDAAEKFRKLGLTTSEASAREAARTQDEIAELLEGRRVDDVAAAHDPSDCPGDERVLDYVAHYGAPGIGQAWRCRVCGREWAKLGQMFLDPASGVHELRPEDVR